MFCECSTCIFRQIFHHRGKIISRILLMLVSSRMTFMKNYRFQRAPILKNLGVRTVHSTNNSLLDSPVCLCFLDWCRSAMKYYSLITLFLSSSLHQRPDSWKNRNCLRLFLCFCTFLIFNQMIYGWSQKQRHCIFVCRKPVIHKMVKKFHHLSREQPLNTNIYRSLNTNIMLVLFFKRDMFSQTQRRHTIHNTQVSRLHSCFF